MTLHNTHKPSVVSNSLFTVLTNHSPFHSVMSKHTPLSLRTRLLLHSWIMNWHSPFTEQVPWKSTNLHCYFSRTTLKDFGSNLIFPFCFYYSLVKWILRWNDDENTRFNFSDRNINMNTLGGLMISLLVITVSCNNYSLFLPRIIASFTIYLVKCSRYVFILSYHV